jgi:uncharacterized protein
MNAEPAKKLTIFTCEARRHHHRPLFEALVEELNRRGIAMATATRGIAGFGRDRAIATINIEVLSFNLPVIVEATDTAEKIDAALTEIAAMLEGVIVEVMPAQMIRQQTAATDQ